MSLVAYDASSDEESDDNEPEIKSIEKKTFENGHISDEDEGISAVNESVTPLFRKRFLNLPNPSQTNEQPEDTSIGLNLANLPPPLTNSNVIEEDDEFLHKKPESKLIEKPPKVVLRAPVKITIPSLSEFKDLDDKIKPNKMKPSASKPVGLLNLLPTPKNDVFIKPEKTEITDKMKPVTYLVPDSVKNQQLKSKEKKTKNTPTSSQTFLKSQTKKSLMNASDSESDDENDFFSLNTDDDYLPEVSPSEINAMVAKRAAKMAETSSKINNLFNMNVNSESEIIVESIKDNKTNVNSDEQAIQALVGSRAKRRKGEEVNIVELSSEQVLPNKDEWLRQALTSSTSYQAKGVLTDEEPLPGTRKKHQITYLAHQAKANEQELQAMWAANRHTRRQTQSKYGF